jgi:outer membrane receptor protein involved in Fe transport
MPQGNTSGQSYGRLTAWIGSFALNVDLGKINVTALTGLNSIKSEAQFGFDQSAFSQLAVIEQPKIREFSQQIRVTTQLDGPINFMVGAYYQKLTNTQYNNLKLSDRAYNGTTGRFDSVETFGEQHGRTVSAFGQAIFNVTDQLELAGGARWTNERKSAKVHNLFGVGAFNTRTITYAGSDTVGELQGNYDDNNISPEATLTWRPDRDHTIYAAYKTAFKSGGFTLAPIQTTTTINDQNFGPERVKGFEVGAKGLFADRKLRATFTAFAYDFNGQQVSIYDLTNLRFIITNAGSVRQRGASAGLEFTPNRALQLHTAMTYVHNRFAGFTGQCYGYPFVAGTTVATAVPPPHCSLVPGGGLALQQTYDGRAPARSPEFTANLGAAYTVALNSRSTLDLTGDAFYSDSYHAADNLNPNSRQDAFWRLNASVTLNLDDNRWHVSFIGRNLTNQYYLQFASDRSGGASTPLRASEVRATVARGRELALQVGLNL